jgi:hypothetical protein
MEFNGPNRCQDAQVAVKMEKHIWGVQMIVEMIWTTGRNIERIG